MQEEYAKLFSAAMEALEAKGIQFERLARAILNEVLGSDTSEALVVLMGPESLRGPEVFVERITQTLSGGAKIVCNLIVRQAVRSVPSGSTIPEVLKFEALVPEDSVRSSTTLRKSSYMHEHRTKDDMEEYRDRLEG